MSSLVSFALVLVSFFVASTLLDGMTLKKGIWNYVVVGLLFAVLNTVIGPIIYVLIGLGTLGIGFILSLVTRLVVSAVVLKLVDALTDRLKVKNFKTALLAALVMAATTSVGEAVVEMLSAR